MTEGVGRRCSSVLSLWVAPDCVPQGGEAPAAPKARTAPGRRCPLWWLLLLPALVAAACSETPVEAVGDPLLPDLSPLAPIELFTRFDDEAGTRTVLFTSVLANVGDGDFVVAGEREEGSSGGEDPGWAVTQHVTHSLAGYDSRPVEAPLEWGGDGHSHWHVKGIARYWIVALDDQMEPTDEYEPRYDTKVGFCFYDTHAYQEGRAGTPAAPVYLAESCGAEDDTTITMGLSVGWTDEYTWILPGQAIDITGLPDGFYRIWGEVDPDRWFHEVTTDNNVTWVNVQLSTRERDGAPVVDLVGVGPDPL